MSEWRGLHNQERHEPWPIIFSANKAECLNCGQPCYRLDACRCCLKVEVERLTAQVKAADDATANALRAGDAKHAEVERLTERVTTLERAWRTWQDIAVRWYTTASTSGRGEPS